MIKDLSNLLCSTRKEYQDWSTAAVTSLRAVIILLPLSHARKKISLIVNNSEVGCGTTLLNHSIQESKTVLLLRCILIVIVRPLSVRLRLVSFYFIPSSLFVFPIR